MRRTILASILGIAASVATVASSQAQGVFLFDNIDKEPVKYGTLPPPGYNAGDVVMDTSVVIGLYAGAGVLTGSRALQLLATTTIIVIPGYGGGWYDGGAVAVPPLPGPGSVMTFQVRGWGGMWNVTGASALWQEIVLDAPLPVPMENGPMPLVLNVVPEPSTFALAGLGAATLCFFRRRR